MIGWSLFAAAFVAFFMTHTIPVRPGVKARLQAALGMTGFTAAYSVLSLLMLWVLILAAGQAPYVQLWSQMAWQAWVVLFGMAAVCAVAALAIGRPNPFSFGGARNAPFDPTHPGILRYMRHPLLVALALWAGLHLLPNGDLAHVLLFGVFLGFTILGRRIIDRRNQRLMGRDQWNDLWHQTRTAPWVQTPTDWRGLLLRLGAAGIAMTALLLLHPVVLGVSPLPV
jgi:uncharacterized membrane protein